MTATKCSQCGGRGKYYNEGYMFVTCSLCDGKGNIDEKVVAPTIDSPKVADDSGIIEEVIPEVIPEVKRRGRPKRVIIDGRE